MDNVTWLWNCRCELCDYKTEFFTYQWIPHTLAFWHSITKHPFGYCHIEAVDTITHAKNRSDNGDR